MPRLHKTYSPEFRVEAARMVVETSRAIADVARELGISETSLGNWVRAYDKVAQAAFSAARPRMLRDGLSFPIVNAVEAQVLRLPRPTLTPAQSAEFAALNWRDLCDPWRLARLGRLRQELKAYPMISRVMPTRLGNFMRATEDDLKNAGEDVEGFAFRRLALVPTGCGWSMTSSATGWRCTARWYS